jgi:hypothetical protein
VHPEANDIHLNGVWLKYSRYLLVRRGFGGGGRAILDELEPDASERGFEIHRQRHLPGVVAEP